MLGGRTFTRRKINGLQWVKMPDATVAGIIQVELYGWDPETGQEGEHSKEIYIGAIKRAQAGKDGDYYDAIRIIEQGQLIKPEVAKAIMDMLQ